MVQPGLTHSLEFGCQNSPLLGTNGRFSHKDFVQVRENFKQLFLLCTVKLTPMDQTVICDLLSKFKMTVEGFNG